MIPIRIAPTVWTVAALLLAAGNLRAADPPSAPDGFGAPVQVGECPSANDVGKFTIGLLASPARFEVSADLLFLQPSSGNLVYATRVNPFPFLAPNWADERVRPGFSPAFNIGARYRFGSGGDVQASWTHLSTDDRASAQGNGTPVVVQGATTGVGMATLLVNGVATQVQVIVPATATFPTQALAPQFLIGPPPPYTNASSLAHFAYDAVNLDAGLWVASGQDVQLRVFAGLQGATIRQSLTTTFTNPDASIAFVDGAQSSFMGVGPRLGLDLHYVAGKLDFLGGLGAATLIGTGHSRLNFFTISPINTAAGLVPNTQFFTTPDTTQVIPALDARLGASYTLPLGNFGSLTCALGYQAAVYFSVINRFTLTEVENPATVQTEGTAAVFVRSAVESQSNFMVHGPFLKFTVQF
ncbi:MAG: hypothetical protein K2R98_31840 [Gemmataceae bacterium]|nr:hypothetical protein [Gemmataceae bacterium]